MHTDYNQIYVVSGPDPHRDIDTAFSGQVHGLCGGASSGFLYPQFAALPAIFAAVEADPLRAAVDALYAAAITVGQGYPLLLGELRKAFASLA